MIITIRTSMIIISGSIADERTSTCRTGLKAFCKSGALVLLAHLTRNPFQDVREYDNLADHRFDEIARIVACFGSGLQERVSFTAHVVSRPRTLLALVHDCTPAIRVRVDFAIRDPDFDNAVQEYVALHGSFQRRAKGLGVRKCPRSPSDRTQPAEDLCRHSCKAGPLRYNRQQPRNNLVRRQMLSVSTAAHWKQSAIPQFLKALDHLGLADP
ncbi:hypothetical protein NLM33_38280 [Bradyrhizobium sp. CCGUVB1N3]|uniref:hypothetical protein n=1 Tax=Bradyrhizobium sp. CCGUVB1N3 TaxID=2949629 RepID=UPI0020B37552|nr:hypothetical protein [Bradyrhizobium sp. CCGUVB1N3]MCP3476082.1 hypothetical protein [Bradyrhizobium sp. CCGUVB1N3]